MLTSALDHYRTQQAVTAAALVQLRRARFGSLDTLVRTMLAYQVVAARESARAFPLMLDEQNLTADLAARPRPEALAGAASDGRSMRGLLDYTRADTVTDAAFAMIVATQLQDVARQSAAISMGARPAVQGYVRQVNAPSCSRCAILAGKFFRHNQGFQRHPRCDCRHVPTTNANAGDLRTEPRDYFESLSKDEQDRVFTQSGAEAIRLGADPGEVVNARRGMSTSQPITVTPAQSGETVTLLGKPLYTPPVASQPAAVAGRRRLAREDVGGRLLYTTDEAAGSKAARARMDLSGSGGRRLMPESILEIAGTDRTEAIRLLRANGYLE